jgi:hypothetical protein
MSLFLITLSLVRLQIQSDKRAIIEERITQNVKGGSWHHFVSHPGMSRRTEETHGHLSDIILDTKPRLRHMEEECYIHCRFRQMSARFWASSVV